MGIKASEHRERAMASSGFGDTARAVSHMNKDHHESLLAYVHWYAKKTEECEVSSSKDLRKATVFMHIEAFNNLGIAYRLRTGYYTQIARMGAFLVYKKTRSYAHVAIPAAAIAVGALVYYKRLAKR